MIEWWALQIVSLFVAKIGSSQFAASTIFTNLYATIVSIAYGYRNSLNSINGNAMGMNDSRLAILFFRDALLLALALITLLMGLLNLLTSDALVIEIADSCLIFLTL